MCVRCAGGCVEEQVVEGPQEDGGEKLADYGGLVGPRQTTASEREGRRKARLMQRSEPRGPSLPVPVPVQLEALEVGLRLHARSVRPRGSSRRGLE